MSAMHMVARNDVAHLAALVELVDADAIRIDISESGRIRGKVIIVP
ncbi:hypothetical protein ACGFYU_02045 [Streptomyces sp. NPDC048337]